MQTPMARSGWAVGSCPVLRGLGPHGFLPLKSGCSTHAPMSCLRAHGLGRGPARNGRGSPSPRNALTDGPRAGRGGPSSRFSLSRKPSLGRAGLPPTRADRVFQGSPVHVFRETLTPPGGRKAWPVRGPCHMWVLLGSA